MSQLLVVPACCADCGETLRPVDRFCSQCGAPVGAVQSVIVQQSTNVVRSGAAHPTILHNRSAVLGLLLCLGPLALPLLWFSRAFRRPTKIGLTVAFLIVTVVAPLAVIFYFLGIAVRPLLEALGPVSPA